MNRRWCLSALAALGMLTGASVEASADPTDGPVDTSANMYIDDSGMAAGVGQSTQLLGQSAQPPAPGVMSTAYLNATYDFRTTLACGDQRNPDANDNPTNCTFAQTFCATAANPGSVYYYEWYRFAGDPPGPWTFTGAHCSTEARPEGAPAPPPVPSTWQLRQAFTELPFARPHVTVYPVGGVTLVNLPTFYAITWDETGLAPGAVSEPTQLLSWSVEFRIDTATYVLDHGDGTRSPATNDPSAPYPRSTLAHKYTAPGENLSVTAQTTLTGSYRANGGAWIPLAGVADLPDEPVTTLTVRQARAQLITP